MKIQRYFASQTAKVRLPSPKLARISANCQQNAVTKAEDSAPLLNRNLFTVSSSEMPAW